LLRKTKRLIAACAAATALVVASPAAPTAGASVAPCRAAGALSGTGFEVVVEGQYAAPGPYDVRLTCYVVQNGIRIASFTDSLTGPVAVVAGRATIPLGPYEICHTLFVRNIVDLTSRSETNC
jgi:hypothetical protein